MPSHINDLKFFPKGGDQWHEIDSVPKFTGRIIHLILEKSSLSDRITGGDSNCDHYNILQRDLTHDAQKTSLLTTVEIKSTHCISPIPVLRKFCSCGECSLIAIFDQTCPREYGALLPHLHSTTLMSFYSSDLLLPADNWWRVPNVMMLLMLGGRGIGLPLIPSIVPCDGIHLTGTRAGKYHAEKDIILNVELHFKLHWVKMSHHCQEMKTSCSSGHANALSENEHCTVSDPSGLASVVLLLLLIAGDVEVNPGPRSETFRQLVKRLSNEIEAQSLHSQGSVIVSMHMTLLPEAGGSIKAKPRTLEGLYNGLCSSRKYHNHSDRIFYCIVQMLSLNVKDAELQMLKKHADLQPEDILNSKDIKFLKLINFLSYEPKESLIDANILPGSSRGSTKDAAEIISGLIQTGHIAPTSASLVNLLKFVKNNESYKMRIKEVLDAPAWTSTKATTAIVTSFDDPVEPDSPQPPESSHLKSLGTMPHGSSGWIVPIIKSSDTPASVEQLTLGDEPVSAPTIMELAVLPTLEDAWEDLGTALCISDEMLQLINKKFPTVMKKQKELFRAYLRANPNPTWSDIINALVKINKEDIARKVIDTFNLSSELLVVARKSIKTSTFSAVSRIEPDTVPARVSKTEVHSSTLAKSFSPDKPLPKHRIESDDGVTLSAKVTADSATVTPTFTRISKTEVFSPKKLDRPLFDPSKPQPKQPRVVSDDGGGTSPVEETDSPLQMVERDSASMPPDDERELKSIQMHFSSDPISDRIEHSSVSVSDREQSFSKVERQPSEENSPSSDDFHSAEETPLDTTSKKESHEGHQLVPRSHLSHHDLKRLHDAVMSVNVEEVRHYIRENSAIVNIVLKVDSRQTALHIAAKLGFKEVAKVLLQHKASVIVKDSDGCTPLYLAASSGNYEIAKLIIAAPDHDMNTSTKDGTPLLYDPASKGFSMICELLLENGTNPLTETRMGVSPLYVASKNGHKDVVRILLKFGADVTRVCVETSKTPLQEAIDNEHIEVTKLLMKAISEVDKKNERLFECATAEKVHELIKHGASVDARKANGLTPLIVHSSAGNKEVVQALIEEKANVDIQDNDGWSALMVASRNGHIETVRSLIYAGAIPDLKNKEGLTALMCATLAAHMNAIKELLLAKADPMLKRKDGKSAMEIAEQYGNQEIIATLKRHTTSASSGNDPLYNLLGSYLELKKTKASEKQAKNGEKIHMTAALKRRESLSSLLPKSPGATAKDDTSTAKQELEKCYKRIADLETRIHDLTLQTSVEVPVETDLAHLERRRLEDEYSKLKELKRKAEQYAVEAKQTAQRLSAENTKLREELNKERKYNEITRANIIREFESKASHDTMGGEKLTTKMEILEQEIQEKAYHLLRRMPQDKESLKRVELKAVEIKEMIFEKRVTINCLELAIMGLPLSGKTELLCQMLELNVDSAKPSSSLTGLHQIVLCHDQYNESLTWIKSTGENCSIQPVSTALAKTLVCMHRTSSLSSCMSGLVEPSSTVEEFSDFSVNHHFKEVLENIQKVALQLESKGSLDMLVTSSLSIFNLANTKLSRVAYEISCILASRTRNLLIMNMLNLEKHSPEHFVNLSVTDEILSENIKPKTALHCFMDGPYAASRNHKGKCVINVGTHKDKLSQGKLKETKKSLEQITMGYAESVGVAHVMCPGMECINTKDPNDCQRLQNRIVELIDQTCNFQYNIPISYLFLLSYLQGLNQMFISRKRLIEIANTCGVTNEDDIEEFLLIFNASGSLIYSNDDEISTLRDYIILNPYEFIKALDKLDSIKTISFNDKLELFEQVNSTRLGFISAEMATYLWPGEGEGRMTQAHFILSLLKELKFILPTSTLHLETDFGKANAGKLYYMPMLRADYDTTEIQGDSNSLIITHNNAVLPFRLQMDTLLQIQNQFGINVTFDPKPLYNTICFKWQGLPQEKCETNIIFRFYTEQVEVSVQFPNQAPRMATVTKIYSQLKTACVQTFQLLSTQVKTLKYEFMLVCPQSKEQTSHSTPGRMVHFIQFHPLMAGEEKLFCQSCQMHVNSEKLPWAKLLWTQVAYQGPIKDVIYQEGYLTNEQITLVCQSLAGRLNLNTIDNFAKQLKSSGSKEEAANTGHPFTALESLLHFLIFTWKSRNPINSAESLAKILHTCGCYQEAITLDPLLVSNSAKLATSQESNPSLSDKEWSAIATYLPQSTMKQLLSSTTKSDSSSQREGIAREGIIRKLSELEYHSLAVALEIGWFL